MAEGNFVPNGDGTWSMLTQLKGSIDTKKWITKIFEFVTVLFKNTAPGSTGNFTTAASTTYTAQPQNVSNAESFTVFLDSANYGTMSIYTTEDDYLQLGLSGCSWYAVNATPILDPKSGRYVYEYLINKPAQFCYFQYQETSSAGSIYGGIVTRERGVA